MPGRTPNIPVPKGWQNRIFSRAFQNEIQKEVNARSNSDQSAAQSKTTVPRHNAHKTNEQKNETPKTILDKPSMTSSDSQTTKYKTVKLVTDSSKATTSKLESSSSQVDSIRAKDEADKPMLESPTKVMQKSITIETTDHENSSASEDQADESNDTFGSADENCRSVASDTSSEKNAQLELKIAAEAQKVHSHQFDSKIKALIAGKKQNENQTAHAQPHSTLISYSKQLSAKESVTPLAAPREDITSPTTSSTTSNDFVFFPLERAAAGFEPFPNSVEAKELEQASRNRLKKEIQIVAEAKLTVSEAKLDEFEAKLSARQAKVNERHANLCYRRALITEAEDKLQMLESGLDAQVEVFHDREKRVKIREKRAKQEEIRLQIIESELMKREVKITQGFANLKKRKTLLDEKEAIFSTMNDVVTEKENRHTERETKQLETVMKSEKESLKPILKATKSEDRHVHQKNADQTVPLSAMVKLEQPVLKRQSGPKNSWKRHSSYDGELTIKSKTNTDTQNFPSQTDTLPRLKSKSRPIMGLWL